jgi:hypothetical protein
MPQRWGALAGKNNQFRVKSPVFRVNNIKDSLNAEDYGR